MAGGILLTDKSVDYFVGLSTSVQWRQQGTEHYKIAVKEGLSPAVREERLKKAIHDYGRALNTAQGR